MAPTAVEVAPKIGNRGRQKEPGTRCMLVRLPSPEPMPHPDRPSSSKGVGHASPPGRYTGPGPRGLITFDAETDRRRAPCSY